MTLALLPNLLALISTAALAVAPAQEADPDRAAVQPVDAEELDRLGHAERSLSEAERRLALHDDVRRAAELLAAAEPALLGPDRVLAAEPLLARALALATRLAPAAQDESLDDATRAALARLLAAAEAARPSGRTESPAGSPDALGAVVENALLRNDVDAIRRLGVHALPAFEAIVASPESRDVHVRALEAFLELHPGPTATALRTRLASGALDVAVLEIVAAVADVLRDERSWFAVSDTPPRRYAWTVPELPRLVEDLLADPRAREAAVEAIRPALERNALTAPMIQRIGAMLESEDLALAQRTFRLLERTSPTPAELLLLEHGLDSPHAVIRLRSVEALHEHVPTAPFLVMSGDPDLAVRRAVAEGLADREVTYLDVKPGGSHSWAPPISVWYGAAFPEATREAFARLLNDQDPTVRAEAIRALPSEPDVVPVEAVVQLAREGSSSERELLLEAGLPRDVRVRVLAELAHRPDGTALPRLTGALLRTRPLEQILPLLEPRWGDVLVADLDLEVLKAILSSGPVLESLVGWLVAHGEEPHLLRFEELLRTVANEGTVARALPDDLMVGWIRKLAGAPRANARVNWTAAKLVEAGSGRPEVALRILSDPEVGTELRLSAAFIAARRDDDAFRVALRDLLSVVDDRPSAPTHGEVNSVQNVGHALPIATRNRTIAAFIGDTELGLAWVAPLAASIQYQEAGAREAAAAVLSRWSGEQDPLLQAVDQALQFAEQWPELTTDELLLRAMRNPLTAEDAMRVIVARRDARWVPVLRDALATNVLTGNSRVRVATIAVQGLLAVGDGAAVEVLLEGLGHDSEAVRTACASALDQIERTRQRREAWRARAEVGGTLETALADLRPLLAHEDVTIRAEAVRSLGTLGSPLDIPRLIPLLTDGEAKVREAARAALDRLHALDAAAPAAPSKP